MNGAAHAESPARILIVDDEPLNVDYLEQELEALGFVTDTAATGTEALERVTAAPPDLVLLDVMMPGLDGLGVLRLLKADPETRLIPVVVMTALNAVEDRVRGIEAGADDFLSKPVDDRELLARIGTTLRLKRTIDETVAELRSANAHLHRFGAQEREVAVLAVDWRRADASLPPETLAFVGRSRRAAAEERIRERGGITVEGDGSLLVAVFDASDPRAGSTLAVEAALAVVADAAGTPAPRLAAAAAISLGRARVGSTRARGSGESRWTYGAQGPAVERASEVVRRAAEAGVVLAADAAAVVADRFELERAHSGTYRVLARVAGDARRAPERSIRTILVTDIVGSTRTIEHVGDRLWNELVAAHDEAIRSEVVAFGGEEIDTAGDGFLASFDSPTRAIGCALALPDRVASLGLEIRVGIHAGEVEHSFEKPRGTAVHLASRIAATAGAGEILVSATTRELAAGAAFVFDDRGEYVLKGLSEPKRLYAVVDRDADGVGPAPSRHSPADCGSDRPAGLTEREVDVLRLVAFGLSDAEAAERLFLSVRTVNAHLRSVYRKLGVRSRAAAGRFALINGLLEPERPA